MTAHISKDPLHGVTLEMMVNALAEIWLERVGRPSKLTVSEKIPALNRA
jgi:hypothetical protein